MEMAETALQVLCLCCLVQTGVRDVRTQKVDIRVLAVFVILSVFLIFVGKLEPFSTGRFMGLIPGAALMAVSKISSGAIGMGDGVIVLWLGYVLGIILCLNTLAVAWALCFFAALILFVMRRKNTIPFIPFLCIGYFVNLINIYSV
ncbi:MAG: hypothetical protein ACI39R_09020 [Lachnospiraceae bacterium]